MTLFTTHKPWWPYYYIHNALPFCWFAGSGIALVLEAVLKSAATTRTQGKDQPAVRTGWNWSQTVTIGLFMLCSACWMGSRVYLEEQGIRKAPKLYTCLVLKEVERFKPFTKFLFSDQPIYSFYADLPMAPHLAMISLKRLWTGEMTNARLVSELEETKPGLILLGKDSIDVPYQELLNREYHLVYSDGENRLYAHESISRSPQISGKL